MHAGTSAFSVMCLASGLCTGRANKSYLAGVVIMATRLSYTHVHMLTHPRRPLSACSPSLCNERRHHHLTPLIPQSLILLDFSLGWCTLPSVVMQFCSPAPLMFRHPDLTPFVLVYRLISSRFHFHAIPLLARCRALFSTSLDS